MQKFNKSKFISFLMLIVMLFSLSSVMTFAEEGGGEEGGDGGEGYVYFEEKDLDVSPGRYSELIEAAKVPESERKITIEAKAEAGLPTSPYITYAGKSIGGAAWFQYDGKKMPAFCVDPNKGGAGEHPNKEYKIRITGTNNIASVAAILHNTYPYKEYSELGEFSDLSEMAVYSATKAAMRQYHWMSSKQYPDKNAWQAGSGAEGARTLAFAKHLMNLAESATKIPDFGAMSLSSIPEKGAVYQDDEYWTYEIMPQSNYPYHKDASIRFQSEVPEGTDFYEEDGTTVIPRDEEGFIKREQDQTFLVKIPRASVPEDGSGTFALEYIPTIESDVILFGVPLDPADANYQRYEVPMPVQCVVWWKQYSYGQEKPPIEEPPKEVIPPTSLIIYKIEEGTTTKLPGAEIRVTHLDSGVEGVYFTDENGEIRIKDVEPGNYIIEELHPPVGYSLDEVNFKQEVNVPKPEAIEEGTETPEIAPIVVTFSNKKESSAKLYKVDADTGERLAGATIRFSKDGGHEQWEETTDENGEILLEDLEAGTYDVQETVAPLGYVLDDTRHTIKIVDGEQEPFSVTLKNRKKPGLTIVKYDEGTGEPLPGAEFSVARGGSDGIGGTIIHEDMITDSSGMIELPDLDPGIYTITEIAPPFTHIKSKECSKTILLEEGKAIQVKFDNRERPKLKIKKVDEETKEPLAGAKFKVWTTEKDLVGEYVTDASGEILIKTEHDTGVQLDEGIHTIEEIVAPHGYILETQHKDVNLEWGQTKEVVFTNKAKPRLRIQKVDVQTGEFLKNAEFRVEKVEDKTVSEYILENGEITLSNLDEAIYKATEFLPPEGYLQYDESKQIMLEWGKTKTLKFDNIRKPVAMFKKTNGLTGLPVPGAKYLVEYEQPGGGTKVLGSFTTDSEGRISIPKAEPGWYIFTETHPAPGFSLPTNPVTRMYFAPGDNAYLSRFDSLYTAGTGKYASGEAPGDGTTGEGEGGGGNTGDKNTIIPNDELDFEAMLARLEVNSGSEYYVEGEGFNFPLNSVVLKKADANTGELLSGAEFELSRVDEQVSGQPGTQIGRYVTDASGVVVIVGLEPGYYVAKEVKAPTNYAMAETSLQNGFLKPNGTSVLEMTFRNYPFGSILISKIDGITGTPLANAKFKVTKNDGTVVGNTTGEFITDTDGKILIENVPPGDYVVTEISAPDNYAVNTTPKTVKVGTDGKTYKTSFENYPYGTLTIKKYDSVTREPLANAEFMVTDSKGIVIGDANGKYTTDANGTITIPNLANGTYIVEETKAPKGYRLENQEQTIVIEYGRVHVLDFFNEPTSGVQIEKLDSRTKEPLQGAEFEIHRPDNTKVGGTYVTDATGKVIITDLEAGIYNVTETKAPYGYDIDKTTERVIIKADELTHVTFYDTKLLGLQILKVDESDGKPLAGAKFNVKTAQGMHVGDFTTDVNGQILVNEDAQGLPLPDGEYIITETKAPTGYMINETPRTVTVTAGVVTPVEFTNQKLQGLTIQKLDSANNQPLAGAKFEIWEASSSTNTSVSSSSPAGHLIGTYTTDNNGVITIEDMANGTYLIKEIEPPKGYRLDNANQTVTIGKDKQTTATFTNTKEIGVQIIKKDSQTGQALQGATFEIWQTNVSTNTSVSSSSPAGALIGTYTTDINGVINVVLEDGTYEIIETQAPEGYQIDNNKQDIVVSAGQQTSVTFTNTQLIGLMIEKVDNSTNEPLQGAEFMVETPGGERIGTYVTDSSGTVMVSGLASGTYVVTETKAPYGYQLDALPQTVTVTAGKATTVTFKDAKLNTVIIQKLDSSTEQPIEGVEFAITTAQGEELGRFTTDANGLIHLPHLAPGTYMAKELKAADGYNLASEAKMFTVNDQVSPQYSATNQPKLVGVPQEKYITIYNDPLGASQILKTDAVTGKPVEGAVFVISSLHMGNNANGQTVIAAGAGSQDVMINGLHTIIGEVTTSETGIINISNLPKGWYTLQEKKAPFGYELDPTVYNFEITGNGVPTIMNLTNTPIMGKIALTKLSADYNNNTGWNSNTPLEGAVYEIQDEDGFVHDTITTGADGMALSNPIKIGTYYLKETRPPDWYGLDMKNIKVDLKKQGQIASVVAKDPSINLNVGIKKTADVRTPSWGDMINYYLTGIGNESNVGLDRFTVHDKLPDPIAAKIKFVDTGMWSKKYNFKFSYATNLDPSYRELPGTYVSDKHHVIDLQAESLGLMQGEFVTQFKLTFQDKVAPGFKLREAMSVRMQVGSGLNNGYQFTNYADVSGEWKDQIVTANAHWTMKVHHVARKLPKTGY